MVEPPPSPPRGSTLGDPRAVAFCLLLAVGLALLGVRAWSIATHSLAAGGRWSVTKTEMERTVLGGRSYAEGTQALADGWLDLGHWHGFQEVMLRDPVAAAELELDFELLKGAWLVVLFDELPGEERSGLRVSSNPGFPSAFLTATRDGEFLRRQPTTLPELEARGWHHLRIVLRETRIEASLDDLPPVSFELQPRDRQRIGFRSGLRSARIDNVVVRGRDGSRHVETFDRPPGHLRRSLLAAAGAALLCLALLRLLAWGGAGERAPLALASVELALLLGALLLQPVTVRRARSFPPPDADLLAREQALRREEIARVSAEIESTYAPLPAPGVRRLLFLGASQTWGVGARLDEHVWVRQLEALLNRGAGPRFECVNGGVAGARAFQIATVYGRSWSRLAPWGVIVNLGINNNDPGNLARSLERILRTSHDIGARPVLLLEPNSTEDPEQRALSRHRVVRRVAALHQVPLVDMQALMAERRDEGFQWWDFVHLTSFGQRQFAELLHAELLRLGFAAPSPPSTASSPERDASPGTRSPPDPPG